MPRTRAELTAVEDSGLYMVGQQALPTDIRRCCRAHSLQFVSHTDSIYAPCKLHIARMWRCGGQERVRCAEPLTRRVIGRRGTGAGASGLMRAHADRARSRGASEVVRGHLPLLVAVPADLMRVTAAPPQNALGLALPLQRELSAHSTGGMPGAPWAERLHCSALHHLGQQSGLARVHPRCIPC